MIHAQDCHATPPPPNVTSHLNPPPHKTMRNLFLAATVLAALLIQTALAAPPIDLATKAWQGQGGVVVELDAKDASILTALCQENPNRLAHALMRSEQDVAATRNALQEAGLHGRITVSTWDGGVIPFVKNFVNLLICPDGNSAPPREEILRVLAPLGVALSGDGEKIVKPRPGDIDDWPQYLYDETGNAVSNDSAVRPPLGHMQWVGSPRWSRHHETMSSVSACVSGAGKVFYIFDEGNAFSPMLPSNWKLIARDAFNGTILWKRDIDKWTPNLKTLKSGPSTLPRRVIVVGDKLYATLGIEAPVSVLNTTTGETIEILEGTDGTEEIIFDGENLFMVADQNAEKAELQQYPRSQTAQWVVRPKQIIRYDLGKNELVWKKTFDYVAPLTLAGQRNKLFFFNGTSVESLEKEDGSHIWTSEEKPAFENMPTFFAPKLVVRGATVLFAGGEDFNPRAGSRGQLHGLSTEMGKTLWTAPNPASGYKSPEDLFVIDGKAWAGDVYTHRWFHTEEDSTGEFTGVNIATGEVDQSFGHVDAYWFHHRCHMAKATKNYLITCRTGTEFIDPKTGEWTLHHWIRGACLYGIMPANGMIYAPQHLCSCYIGAKMFGFTTVAPKDPNHITQHPTPDEKRLTTISEAPPLGAVQARLDEWPTYRGDTRRSGASAPVADPTGIKWSVKFDDSLTPPVIANGKVVVALKENFAVVAIDARTGKQVWRHVPGARVDSSPTLYGNRVYFGSADGYVNCLALDTGKLIWQYQATPTPARHMYFERLESTHPVHGNVLVMDDKVYTVAGRSMFTDGGMRFLILDANTGRNLTEHIMDDKVPGSDEELQMQQEILNMPQALPDLLSTNGKKIFMRYQQFDLEGNRTKIDYTRKLFGLDQKEIGEAHQPAAEDQKGEDAHVFSATGFLDDSWWHRTYWIYGKHQASGWAGHTVAGKGGAPSGRIMSFNDDRIFVWGRLQRYFRWTPIYEYSLQSCDYDYNRDWEVMMPILLRAMLHDGERLFIAGPEEVVRQSQVQRVISEAESQEEMRRQEQLLKGKAGAKLLQVDPETGRIVSGVQLETTPAFDGMAAAYGNIYLAMNDGSLHCLGEGGAPLPAISAGKLAEYNNNLAVPAPPQKKKGKR